MALIDSEGRIFIGLEVGKRLGYCPGKEICFIKVDDKTYRIEDASYKAKEDEFVLACENPALDEKCRFFVPKTLRKIYTREAIILENKKKLYLQFIRLKADEDWLRAKLLGFMTDDRK